MDNEAMKEVLNELFSHLEKLETQNEAILQFLKEKKRVTDKQLAPYLEQAGNASGVKWRAARVRINHLLEPEHPEKEIKLGKKPELHEDAAHASSREVSSDDKRGESDAKEEKRVESVDEEGKRTRRGNQQQSESNDKDPKKTEPQQAEATDTDLSKREKPTPVKPVQGHSADSKKDRPEERSESKPRNIGQPTQDQREQKSDSDNLHHPTEATEPLAEQQGAEPPAKLKPDKADSGKEAA
jgi:hypothetical protein